MPAAPRAKQPILETPFSIVVDRHGSAAVVRLQGSCTMTVAPQLEECLLALAAEPVALIIIEMSRLDFLESTGLGGIVAGYLKCRRHQGEVCLVAPAPAIRHLLELTRLTQLFRLHDHLEDALAACRTA